MEEKLPKYNRDKALELEAKVDELSSAYFEETTQEAEDARAEVARIVNRQQLNHDLLATVTMMVTIYEKYVPKPEQIALPAVTHDEDEDEFFYPPY